MTKRKYTSEFGLSAESEWVFIVQYDDLDRWANTFAKDIPCHIYLICRRPRITIDPVHFSVDAASVRGVFHVQQGSASADHPFEIPNKTGRIDLRLEAPYPHTHFALLAPDGERVTWGKVGMLAHKASGADALRDLEILYVGQAYGDNGSRTAPDRLKSHSTLLGIYAEALSRAPDHDIYLVLLKFRYFLISSIDGASRDVQASGEEDAAHLSSATTADMPEQLWINFAEAALIRYFTPAYNTLFKTTFPSPAHDSYRRCYDLDLNLLSIALDTSDANMRLWCATVPPRYVHVGTFPLHSPEERRSILDI